ncbi:uncharacterized protein LOC116125050 [Pistacia vera]|uniref:uncharacterized protein LOC116125050 n=1 Tax=Pistacia vera TaxID=55513 RepID=UPI001263BAAC|nr:uncharacterized protein LOC116125050 [Pistacia vera]
MRPQRHLGIYVGYDSPSIIKYLEPLMGDLFIARFVDCHLDETKFSRLGGKVKPPKVRLELSWKVNYMSHLDPRTSQFEIEVQRITHLQNIVNQMSDAFADATRITRSYNLVVNTPTRIDVTNEQSIRATIDSSVTRQKRGRLIKANDIVPRKRKAQNQIGANIDNIGIINNSTSSKLTPEELTIPERT